MARKTSTRKPNRKKPVPKPKVEDAQIVSEEPPKAAASKAMPSAAKANTPSGEAKDAAAKASDTAAKATKPAPAEKPEPPKVAAAKSEPTKTESAKPAPTKPEPVAAKPTPPAEPQVIVKKAGAVPMVLGGLIAGGIGFGAAWYLGQQEGDTQTAALDALRADLTATQDSLTKAQSDLAAATSQIEAKIAEGDAAVAQSVADLVIPDDPAAALSDLGTQIAGVSDQVKTALAANTELAARVTDVEKRPLAENAAEAAVAAYNRELDELRDRLQAQAAELDTIAAEAETNVQTIRDQAMAEIEATRAQAEDLAAQAEADERQAAANAAMGEIAAAAQSGAPFADALAALGAATGAEAPEALASVAETGIATPAALQQAFPPLARQALAASRSNGGSEGGIGGFLSAQLGVRSLAPQEGDSPNAVLSRVESAVASGDLDTALTEIEGLPDTAKDILAPWVQDVSSRNNALVEVETLQRSLAAE